MKHLGKKTIKQKGGQDDDCYKLMRTLSGHGIVFAVALFADGSRIVSGGSNK